MREEKDPQGLIRTHTIERQKLGGGYVRWVESEGFVALASQLRAAGYSTLEALTGFEVALERAVVLTYFLKGRDHESLWIRFSVQKEPKKTETVIPSVVDFWPMANSMEKVLARTMGVRFRKAGH